MKTADPKARPAARRFLARAFGLALLWLGLNGLDAGSWVVGGPVVVGASLLSLRLLPAAHWKWRLGGAVRFLAFFVVESVRGGWDVAWRALAPRPRLAPGLLTYAPRLPAGAARWLFCNAVSLLPGTAVVAIEPERLTVHALAAGPEALRELQRLEERVAGLFGLGDRAAREAKPG